MDQNGFIAWRNSLGFTQTQMAAHLKVARETVSRWENGRAKVPDRFSATTQDAVRVPRRITHVTHPHLYERISTARGVCYACGPMHPRVLFAEYRQVRQGDLLAPVDVNAGREWLDDVLETPAYQGRAAAADKSKAWELTTLARDVFHGVTDIQGDETVAQYKDRTK